MTQVNIHEAKSQLSRLIELAEAGEDVVIARAGKPTVRLTPVSGNRFVTIGLLKGEFVFPDEFDEPLPNELLDLFEGINE
jgi:prevent-host-death family protein